MPSAENAILEYEAGQNAVSMAALTDTGDHKTFLSSDELWSDKAGYEAQVRPNGLETGGAVTPAASGSDDVVDVAALTCYLAGVNTNVAADTDKSITRGSTHNFTRHSVTVTSAGAIAVIDGTEGESFSDTRGAAGGPPWIPTGSIEIAQIHISDKTPAPIAADEIKQVPGIHREMYSYPTWVENRIAVENSVIGYAGVTFNAALPLIHSDDAGSTKAAKKVCASYATPEFAEIPNAYDFVRPATSYTVNSTQVYGGTVGSASRSLGGGSFSFSCRDGITDSLFAEEGSNLWFKFRPHRLKTPAIFCQGILGIKESFPAGDAISAECTISAEQEGKRVIS
ncbi:MAG TPA: hypothetical protein ENN35_00415 [Deltaproteobacteria bacterium]|nr:hypothetical protein [Deltaproteobacteria bacterium]